jgi:hypothetical protein
VWCSTPLVLTPPPPPFYSFYSAYSPSTEHKCSCFTCYPCCCVSVFFCGRNSLLRQISPHISFCFVPLLFAWHPLRVLFLASLFCAASLLLHKILS